MIFPKNFMTISELKQLGLSEETLRHLYHSVGYPLAFKETPAIKCPIKFNTKLLEKHLKRLNERRVEK